MHLDHSKPVLPPHGDLLGQPVVRLDERAPCLARGQAGAKIFRVQVVEDQGHEVRAFCVPGHAHGVYSSTLTDAKLNKEGN